MPVPQAAHGFTVIPVKTQWWKSHWRSLTSQLQISFGRGKAQNGRTPAKRRTMCEIL